MAIEQDKEWRYPLESQHLSGNPIIFGKDVDLVRRMAFEGFFSVGITVEYYRCWYDKKDFYQDPDCKWDDKILMHAVFDDNPRVKVLKDLGWYNEDDEIKSPIIYLPLYKDWYTKEVFDIKDNSLIKVNYFGQASPSEFRITEKKMDSVYGVYWICKLAPERLEDFFITTNDGTHYLKRKTKDDRFTETCEHDVNNTGEDERVYQHGDYEKNVTDDYSSLIMGE